MMGESEWFAEYQMLPDDVALTFGDECVYMEPYLKDNQCIDEKVYNLVMQINEQLELLSDGYH